MLRDWLDGAEHAAIKSYNYTIGTAPVKLLALLLPKDNVIPEDLPSSSAYVSSPAQLHNCIALVMHMLGQYESTSHISHAKMGLLSIAHAIC